MSKKTSEWEKFVEENHWSTKVEPRLLPEDKVKEYLAKEKMELVSRIEGMKVVGEYAPYTDERYHQDSYNQALDDILSALKSEIQEKEEEVGEE